MPRKLKILSVDGIPAGYEVKVSVGMIVEESGDPYGLINDDRILAKIETVAITHSSWGNRYCTIPESDVEEPYLAGIPLICTGCNKTPNQIQEYVDMGQVENMDPNQYVWEEEGTLNRTNGHFLCTTCYVAAGMPSSPTGWKAP
jgi:hypothetical protein